jgi:hypothetical protein
MPDPEDLLNGELLSLGLQEGINKNYIGSG